MLWRPVTHGESVFLHLYEQIGTRVDISDPHNFTYLVDPVGIREFVRLTVTLEVFLRTIRCAADKYRQTPDAHPADYSRHIRVDADVPDHIARDRVFSEAVRDAGRIASERRRLRGIERNALRSARANCYLCGVALTARTGPTRASADHIWPLRLAGESKDENILPACQACNEKKDLAITWAWGPVQSTYEQTASSAERPNHRLTISIALAKLMMVAGRTRNPLTLRAAAEAAWPLADTVPLRPEQPNVYFEILQRMRTNQ
jgi:hypothetical protein